MSDEIPDPAEDFENLNVDNLETGLTDEDLEDVIGEVKGHEFVCAGKQCRVRKSQIEERDGDSLSNSRQKFWVVGVEVDWPEDVLNSASFYFDKRLMVRDDGWIEVRAGHERTTSREEAEGEVEWLAEQVVMLENDPNTPI